MPKVIKGLTEAEWAIIKAVWEHEPCAAPTVQEALLTERNWSLSTVRTMMDRMVAKGLLKTGRIRNLILFRSAITRVQAQQGELHYALKTAFNGALTPMVQCLLESEKLNVKELEELEKLLREQRKKSAQ